MSSSSAGRRILVAVVTGEVGERIQRWRERHDPKQAIRLPPHATLCDFAAVNDENALERQVRHAFAESVTVRLGPVEEFDNGEGTFVVQVRECTGLNIAGKRLYDRTHLALPRGVPNKWHVTCVRYPHQGNPTALRVAAVELDFDLPWRIDRVAHLELRGDRYEPLAEWDV